MKQFCVFILLLFITSHLSGQELVLLDKVTLISGEVYVGEIVLKTNNMLMIKAQNGTRYQFQLSQVKKTTKVPTPKASVGDTTNKPLTKQVGANFAGQFELLAGMSGAKNAFSTLPSQQVSLTFGTKNAFNKELFLGLGIGYNSTITATNTATTNLIPIFIRVQNRLSTKQNSAFIGMDAGYAFSANSNFGGGVLVKVSAGYIYTLNDKVSLIAGVYAGVNSISGSLMLLNDIGSYTYTGTTMMQSAGLKLGLQF